MEEKNKKQGKGKVITIIILILLVLGLSGFIVYDKVLYKYFEKKEVKEENKEESKHEQEKELEFSLEEAEDILDDLYQGDYKMMSYGNGLAPASLYSSIDSNDISPVGMNLLVTNKYNHMYNGFDELPFVEGSGNLQKLSKEKYVEIVKSIFGPSYEYKTSSSEYDTSPCSHFVYDKNQDAYVISQACGYGVGPSTYIYNKIKHYKKTNKRIEIELNYFEAVYVDKDYEEEEEALYQFSGKENLFTKKQDKILDEENKIYEELFSKYSDKSLTKVITFVKDIDNNYYISSIIDK